MKSDDGDIGEAAWMRQQDVLAKFGELALRSDDLDAILTEACHLVGEALGTDLSKVLELQEDGITMFVRAGVGWKPGVVGKVTVRAEKDSSEGYALQTGKPVTSDDIDRETRFHYADFLKDNGVKALVNVAIGGKGSRPFGILQVDSRRPRRFGERETSFLRGYANLLAAAVDRLRGAAELRDAQAALKTREEALSQSNKMEAIGQLTGGVAHDFNNLLTIIGSAADFLRRDDLSKDRRDRYLAAISDTVARASKLTGQLLAFARRQALQPKAFDVGKHVGIVIDLLGSLFGDRIRMDRELCDPACFALADISQFETALVNLAVNARDAMDGEGRLTFKVATATDIPAMRGHAAVSGSFIAVSVTDTGTGMAPAQMTQIFEPFFTTKEVGKGTGLGLSQVFGFAKQSQGEVAVESSRGHGSTFTLYLPHDGSRPEEPTASAAPLPSRIAADAICILVVEDNDAVGQFATEMLHDLGYRTVWASAATRALEVLTDVDTHIDLVFSDVIMPGMNGIELGEAIRRIDPHLPVILTSGYSNVLAEEGTHGFELIHKPYSVEALSRVIHTAIGTGTAMAQDAASSG
ncbi:MAG: ATP-binding protein [Janthinobacterium lividum]